MPVCLACGLRLAPGSGRCGLDGKLAFEAHCPQCSGEIGPQDRYCGHCRQDLSQRPARLRPVELHPAGFWRFLGALAFDLTITLFVVSWWLAPESRLLQASLMLAAVPVWTAAWETWADATPGQQIFGLKRLTSQGGPLPRHSFAACFLAAGTGWLGPARSGRISDTALFRVPR